MRALSVPLPVPGDFNLFREDGDKAGKSKHFPLWFGEE